MPIKRRVNKGRDIDDLRLGELVEGPGSCLLAGAGYYLHSDPRFGFKSPSGENAFFWQASDEGKAIILAAMRADWDRVGAQLIAQHDDPQSIWSFRQFGPPEGWAVNDGSNSND